MRLTEDQERDLARRVLDCDAEATAAVEGTPVASLLREGANGREKTRGKDVERLGKAVTALREEAPADADLRSCAAQAAASWQEAQALRWKLAMSAIGVARAEAAKAASVVDGWLEDARQEAMMGLLDAARRYDPTERASFGTYARWWVRAALKRAQHERRTIRLPESATKALRRLRQALRDRESSGEPASVEEIAREVGIDERRATQLLDLEQPQSMDEQLPGHDDLCARDLVADETTVDPLEEIEQQRQWALTEEALAEILDERSREILVRRYGIGQGGPETLSSIASDYGVTPERVRQLQKRAESRVAEYAASAAA